MSDDEEELSVEGKTPEGSDDEDNKRGEDETDRAVKNEPEKDPEKSEKPVLAEKENTEPEDPDPSPANRKQEEAPSHMHYDDYFDEEGNLLKWPPPKKTPSPPPAPDYVDRPKKRVVIPCVLPWEHVGAKETQKGMGGFGGARNAVTKVQSGRDHHSDAVLSFFADIAELDSQQGMGGFGRHRLNIVKSKGGKEISAEDQRKCDNVIRKQAGSANMPSLKGETPLGAARSQVPKIKYKDDMTEGVSAESEGMVPKLFSANPNCHAGTNVMDKIRSQTMIEPKPPVRKGGGRKKQRKVRKDESIPKLFDPRGIPGARDFAVGSGSSGLNPPRQVTTKVTGHYEFTEEEIIASKKLIPYQTGKSLTSQEGMGGYGKIRDVVNHAKVEF